MVNFPGVIPPIPTPLNKDETIDEPSLRRLIEFLISGSVHGIFVLGTCGEFASLSAKEKKKAVSITVEQVSGRVPVYAQITEVGTGDTISNLKEYSKLNIDYAVVTTPYYYRLSQSDLIRHFQMVIEASDIPLFLYVIPQMTKLTLDVPSVFTLGKDSRLAGIKDSSGDFFYFQELLEYKPRDNFFVLQGKDELFGSSILSGATGGVLGVANFAPRLLVQLYEAAMAGKIGEVRSLQKQVNLLSKLFKLSSAQGVMKYCLKALGVIEYDYMTSPLPSPDSQAQLIIDATLKKLGLCRE